MMKKKQNSRQLRRIFRRKLKGSASPEQAKFLDHWDEHQQRTFASFDELSAEQKSQIREEIWFGLSGKISKKRSYLRYASIFVIGLGVLVAGYWIFKSSFHTKSNIDTIALENDILPGGNHAFLHLANGEKVPLSELQEGIQMGTHITYDDGNPVQGIGDRGFLQFLTLETPRGGNYQVKLPDGTRVWLNASTKLTYPKVFNSLDRTVELEGEAYFEVTKSNTPFFVKTSMQTTQVLGTSFNISAYTEDPYTVTTLVTGKVNVLNNKTGQIISLLPNDQTEINDQVFSKSPVEIGDYIAWKDGLFLYKDTPLKDILKELRRWYDFEIDTSEIPDLHFTGGIRKDVALSKVLQMLASTTDQVVFEIQDHRLKIAKKYN